MARKARKTESKFENRVRFNWGFHDAQHDEESGYGPACPGAKMAVAGTHFDPVWAAGYRIGRRMFRENGNQRHQWSDIGWEAYQAGERN